MAIQDHNLTGQPAYFPGFAATQTSEEPFFVEIEESSRPSPPSPPGWLPSPKRELARDAARNPVPPVPSRPAKPASPAALGGKRGAVVSAPPEEPEEELNWKEQVV